MASHMGKGAKPTSKSPHGIFVAFLGLALLVCGIVMVVFAFAPDPNTDGRPQESVRAELSYTDHEQDRHYDSGYRWWGVCEWSYQGSSGSYESSKGYGANSKCPNTIPFASTWDKMMPGTPSRTERRAGCSLGALRWSSLVSRASYLASSCERRASASKEVSSLHAYAVRRRTAIPSVSYFPGIGDDWSMPCQRRSASYQR